MIDFEFLILFLFLNMCISFGLILTILNVKFLSDVRLSLLALCVSVTYLCFYYEGFSFLDNALSKIFM